MGRAGHNSATCKHVSDFGVASPSHFAGTTKPNLLRELPQILVEIFLGMLVHVLNLVYIKVILVQIFPNIKHLHSLKLWQEKRGNQTTLTLLLLCLHKSIVLDM